MTKSVESAEIRNPLGTRDLNSYNVRIRKNIINSITNTFELFGAEPIETPIIERLNIVKNIYGEEFNKLVYQLNDQGDDLFLRYDLTLPCSRFIATNGIILGKYYQIGKVYRRDHPQFNKGRYREFYQADIDIIGEDYGQMLQEIEILTLLDTLLSDLIKDNYVIKVNHRQILYNMILLSNFHILQLNIVCSSIDKMDKLSIDDIIKELVEDKELPRENVNTLMNMIIDHNKCNSNIEKINMLKNNNIIDETLFQSMITLFDNINQNNIVLDMSLARGLDYYTGIIYEATYKNKNIMPSSIAAGGRYNKLIGNMSNKGDVPAIGLSLGIERLIVIIEKLKYFKDNKQNPFIYIGSIGKNMAIHRLKLCLLLRKSGIYAETNYKKNPKMRSQLNSVFNGGIPIMLILGEKEIKDGVVGVKIIDTEVQYDIKWDNIVDHVLDLKKDYFK